MTHEEAMERARNVCNYLVASSYDWRETVAVAIEAAVAEERARWTGGVVQDVVDVRTCTACRAPWLAWASDSRLTCWACRLTRAVADARAALLIDKAVEAAALAVSNFSSDPPEAQTSFSNYHPSDLHLKLVRNQARAAIEAALLATEKP